jgi:hypothetical protein
MGCLHGLHAASGVGYLDLAGLGLFGHRDGRERTMGEFLDLLVDAKRPRARRSRRS